MTVVDAHWPLFLLASLAVIATPGQDMLLVMSRSIAQGTRAGVATAAGVSVGLVGHTLLATLGLGAVLRASEWLFTALKLAGAAYLLWLGARLLLTRSATLALAASAPRPLAASFRTGAVSNIGNPKVAVFYFAFLPQFVAAGAADPARTVCVLGLVFAALTFAVKGPVALGAGALSSWFRSRPRALLWLHRGSGGVMVALAVRLALTRRSEA